MSTIRSSWLTLAACVISATSDRISERSALMCSVAPWRDSAGASFVWTGLRRVSGAVYACACHRCAVS
ncbi:hypothetical protein, partial [Burkholderia glumae]|uniref:hypothetical protein n=1 Tax=Burkholderia glumae TaxID=337 RepID=UPI001E3BAD6A